MHAEGGPLDAVREVHGLVLLVREDRRGSSAGLLKLLDDLSFTGSTLAPTASPPLVVSVHRTKEAVRLPPYANDIFCHEGLHAVERPSGVYLSDGTSLLQIDERAGHVQAFLAPAFARRPRLLQQRFWAFGILKLLRARGLYGLHAAAVATNAGLNLVVVGPSGSGKSTLTLGLVRHGCSYLSDDALLLRGRGEIVEALTFRKPFSFDMDTAEGCADLPVGPARPSSSGRMKRRADIQAAYPAQHLPSFVPNAIVFPRITPATSSVVGTLTRGAALGRLLAQSGAELFDRATMAAHLQLLQRLLGQAAVYELEAGRDLLQHPTKLLELLGHAQRSTAWRASLSN